VRPQVNYRRSTAHVPALRRHDLPSRLEILRSIRVRVLDDQQFGPKDRVAAHDRDGCNHEWLLTRFGLEFGDSVRRPSREATERGCP
jgi:hypothetical protein